MMSRRNVLLIVADQLRADHLGCYGNPVVQTPAIDSIAARAALFERFHVASTVCMPNRATLLTGRLPSLHGVRRNGIPLSLAERTFPEQMRQSGYSTALIGKAHFQPYGMGRREAAAGLEARAFPGWPTAYMCEDLASWRSNTNRPVTEPYYGFEHTELCLYHGDKVEGDYARWLVEREPSCATFVGRENSIPDPRYSCRDAWRTRVPEELYSSAYIADRACNWLSQRESLSETPFLLVCSFPDPHHPFTPPGRFWDMYDPESVHLPVSFSRGHPYPPFEYVRQATKSGATKASSHHPFAPEEREAREAIALTYGMISNMDCAIGKILDALRSTGLEESTTVVFTSDHGDMMGDHGVMLKGPMHFQGLTRVPFLWADAATASSPKRVLDVGGTIDVARTILAHTGTEGFNGLHGRDLAASMRGTISSEGVLIENETAQLTFGRPHGYSLRTLVVDGWRVTYCTDEALCELYDLIRDPDEMCNLWFDDAYLEKRNGLVQELLRCIVCSAETSPMPLASG